ncbi:hypothetical protein LCGC14_2744490, partial [marine sediment metagenome]
MARNPLIRKIPKMTGQGTGGHKSAGILDDFAVRKNVATKEGTVEKVPVNENDITNKAYVDNIATRSEIDLFLTENASDIGGYFDMETNVVTAAKENIVQSITANSTTLIASFASILDDGEIDAIRLLENGVYGMHIHAEAALARNLFIYFEFYHRTAGGTETLLGTSHDSGQLTTSEAEYNVHASIESDKSFIAGDRIVAKVYGRNTGAADKNITIYMEGDTASRVEFPGFVSLSNFVMKSGDTMTGDLTTTGLNLSKVGANIITATNANGDLRLGAGGGTNDLKINVDGKIDIFEELNMNTKKIINVVDPTSAQEASTKNYHDQNKHRVFQGDDNTGATLSAAGQEFYLNLGTVRMTTGKGETMQNAGSLIAMGANFDITASAGVGLDLQMIAEINGVEKFSLTLDPNVAN